MANYIFSLTPTFTQGLVLGQLSILILLGVILKYLFLDSGPATSDTQTSYPAAPFVKERFSPGLAKRTLDGRSLKRERESESTDWFNLVLRQVRKSLMSRLLS